MAMSPATQSYSSFLTDLIDGSAKIVCPRCCGSFAPLPPVGLLDFADDDDHQVVDELGVSIDKLMDAVPALRNWMERQQAADSLAEDLGGSNITIEGLKPKHPVIIIPGDCEPCATLFPT